MKRITVTLCIMLVLTFQTEAISQVQKAEDDSYKYSGLTKAEKLRYRMMLVDGAKEAAKDDRQITLTGTNKEIMTITLAMGNLTKTEARTRATAILDSYLKDKEVIRMAMNLDMVAIAVTDGRRSWTKILKTGEFIERRSKPRI
jgi:hypothetical protein